MMMLPCMCPTRRPFCPVFNVQFPQHPLIIPVPKCITAADMVAHIHAYTERLLQMREHYTNGKEEKVTTKNLRKHIRYLYLERKCPKMLRMKWRWR